MTTSETAPQLASALAPRYYRDPRPNPPPLNQGCIEADDFPAGLVANLEKTFHAVESGMPRGAWRAPLHTFHAFAVQSFIDEVASRHSAAIVEAFLS